MSSLLRIRQLYSQLASNERRLADYLLSYPDRARHLSSQKLAEEVGISQSGVVKFSQKLGYKGFPALKLALSESIADSQAMTVHNHILSDDPLKVVGEKLLSEKQSAIRATLDINSEERLIKALLLIKNARRLILAGVGASGLVAKDFAWKLMKIGFNATAEQDMHALLVSVQALTGDDLLLLISCSGERREVVLAAKEAQQAGIHVLALTRFAPNQLQQYTHHCLYTVAEESIMRSAAIASTTAQMMLTDLLFLTLAQSKPELAAAHIRRSESLIKKLL